MSRPPFLLAFVLAAAVPAALAADVPATGRHVLVVVWDGMRPDFISEQYTPNLWALAHGGVYFTDHHPAYVSSTEVNGTTIATGAYPERSTVIANVEYRPRIDPQVAIGLELPEYIRKGDALGAPGYVAVPTLAEFLHAQGVPTAIAGSKQVALLHDRSRRPNAPGSSPVVYDGAALPGIVELRLAEVLGDIPKAAPDNGTAANNKVAKDAWTTAAMTEVLWKAAVPAYSLVWLAEPDYSQHQTGPGSAQSLLAIKSSDTNLGRLLADLERRGLRATTDVLVVSDHGFSTISATEDIATDLSTAGFSSCRVALGGLHDRQVLVVGNNGVVQFYIGGHDPELARQVACWAQTQAWAGVVFSRTPIAGTFPLAEAKIASPEAPDVMVAMRWTLARSATGAPGLICSDGASYGVGQGAHASLCPTEMHNTLVAAGPDFRPGVRDALPTGNIDLAPTILWLLGYHDEALRRDGRVLSEALSVSGPPLRSYETRRLTAERSTAGGAWQQYLLISEVNGVRYLDEGNGAFVMGHPPKGP